MYIIERLNEKILENYHILITSDVSIFESLVGDGIGTLTKHYYNPTAHYTSDAEHLTSDLAVYIMDYVDLMGGVVITEDDLKQKLRESQHHTGFWFSFQANRNQEDPTENELQKWKAGELDLYTHEVSVVVSINGSKISNTILHDLMFGGE